MDDYFESTVATFHALTDVLDSPAEVDAAWERLKKEHPEWEQHKSPKSESEYLTDRENGDIYRKSHHWGRVASCNWKISLVNQGAYAIGKANVRDFERKQGYLDLAETAKRHEWRQYVNAVNRKFNEDLEKLTEENAREVQLDCGMPSRILLSCGIEEKPIRLYGAKLLSKAAKHGYDISAMRNLPKALSTPIAVFTGSTDGSYAILTELQIEDKNVLVSLSVGKGGHDVDFNIVSSLYGKRNDSITHWINNGKMLYVDKEKALGYISVSAPIAEAQYKQELDSATKVIKDFKNPVIAGEKNSENEIITKAVGADGRPIKVYNANTARREEWDDDSGVKFSAGISDWWQTIKDLFMDLLRKAGIRLSKPIGDNELRYILWRSYNRLENRGIFGEAENVVMENRLMERSVEEGETEKLSVAQAKSHLEQMRKKYKHLDNIEIVDGAKMTPEELASIFDYQIIDDAERKEIKRLFVRRTFPWELR